MPTFPSLSFVTCVSDLRVLESRLLSSPCFSGERRLPLQACFNARSAADAFNASMQTALPGTWVVWVHQDVFLPADWDTAFLKAVADADADADGRFPNLAVAGVYGLEGSGPAARRAGHVLDRGNLLREPAPLPCRVDSLDELLFAVKAGSGLVLDPDLAFDFYATDLVLEARRRGMSSVVVDAYCEHWSGTAAAGKQPQALAARINASAAVFERKWASSLPITTPCFDIHREGDVARFIQSLDAS